MRKEAEVNKIFCMLTDELNQKTAQSARFNESTPEYIKEVNTLDLVRCKAVLEFITWLTSVEDVPNEVDIAKCKLYANGKCKSPINKSCKQCSEIKVQDCYYKQLQEVLEENRKLRIENKNLSTYPDKDQLNDILEIANKYRIEIDGVDETGFSLPRCIDDIISRHLVQINKYKKTVENVNKDISTYKNYQQLSKTYKNYPNMCSEKTCYEDFMVSHLVDIANRAIEGSEGLRSIGQDLWNVLHKIEEVNSKIS